jgi:hypothetical protein
MEYRDIYSKYPELATRLVRTSSQINTLPTLGNCNLDLSDKEIVKILDIKPYAKKAIFNLYNESSGDGPGLYFEVIIFIKEFIVEKNYRVWLYVVEAPTKEEHGDYHVLDLPLNSNYRSLSNMINSLINMDGIYIKSLDVKSLYLLYNQRKSCLQIPNYAINKTLEIFNEMIDKFNTYDTAIAMNLYLLINAIVLDIDISPEFIDSQKRFSAKGEDDYDYDNYFTDTENERNEIIGDIKFAIRNF